MSKSSFVPTSAPSYRQSRQSLKSSFAGSGRSLLGDTAQSADSGADAAGPDVVGDILEELVELGDGAFQFASKNGGIAVGQGGVVVVVTDCAPFPACLLQFASSPGGLGGVRPVFLFDGRFPLEGALDLC